MSRFTENWFRPNRTVLCWVALSGAVIAWLAPITLGGRMPVGGDVTSFFLPLMAYYRQSLMAGRVPLWNELWGFGFPMLAESQAGVFYPPHLLLFRLLETESAYSVSIVIHALLAAWFAYRCGRTFGLRPPGATLAAMAFAGNGFFVVHFPHQWSYTAGCWLPLAVALAWKSIRSIQVAESAWNRVASLIALGAVLAVQMMAGHFQIAFYTQVVVLLMALLCSIQFVYSRLRKRTAWGSRAALVMLAPVLAAAFSLAAVQLLPTYELIKVALPEGRSFEYLSGFAGTPFHLVSYLFPSLFHINPLWRPVAWDPFHTSPEECLGYIGLLPICLGLAGAWRWRREPRVQLWVLLAVITLLLSFGPYMPGFRSLILLPGFSGFRSAARWNVATALFLALLAGRAMDGVRAIERLRIWLRGLAVVFVLLGMFSFGWCWLMVFGAHAGSVSRSTFEWMETLWSEVNPWGERAALQNAELRAHEPPTQNPWAIPVLARLGYRITPTGNELTSAGPRGIAVRSFTLADEFRTAMLQELLPPTFVLGAHIAILYVIPWRRRAPQWTMLALVALDLGAATWLRPTDFVRRGSLVEQSPLLSRLARDAQGERVDLDQNLPMLAGAATSNAYRTVNIEFASQWFGPRERVQGRSDLVWRVLEAYSPSRGMDLFADDTNDLIDDPVLAGCLYGPAVVQQLGVQASGFILIRRNPAKHARAWFWSAGDDPEQFRRLTEISSRGGNNPADLTVGWLYRSPATPVSRVKSDRGLEEFALNVNGPGMLIISQLAYPGWSTAIHWPDGRTESAPAIVGRAGCLMVPITTLGEYKISLEYRSRAYELGRLISLVSLAVWVPAMALSFWARRRTRREIKN